MSGPDNIQGLDYQVTYCVLRILEALCVGPPALAGIQVESLSEDEEDLNLYFSDGTEEFIQIKKKTEGYQWTGPTLRPVLRKFNEKRKNGRRFRFVSDAPLDLKMVQLREAVREGGELPASTVTSIVGDIAKDHLPDADLRAVLPEVNFQTNYHTSHISTDPGINVREAAKRLLVADRYALSGAVESSFTQAWRIVFNLGKSPKFLRTDELVSLLSGIGVSVRESPPGDQPPALTTAIPTEQATRLVAELGPGITALVGPSGSGKTTAVEHLFTEQDKALERAYFALGKLSTIESFLDALSGFLDEKLDLGTRLRLSAARNNDAKAMIAAEDIAKSPCIICIDSIDSATDTVQQFVGAVLGKILQIDCLSSIVICSQSRPIGYDQGCVDSGDITEINWLGFTPTEGRSYLTDAGIEAEEREVDEFHQAVGGLPLAYALLIKRNAGLPKVEIGKAVKDAANAIYERVVGTKFAGLQPRAQVAAVSLACMPYEFGREQAGAASASNGPMLLADLQTLQSEGFIANIGGLYRMHDGVRAGLVGVLDRNERRLCHRRLVEFYEQSFDSSKNSGSDIVFDEMNRWGFHLDEMHAGSSVAHPFAAFRALSPQHVTALWEIRAWGYPSAFSDEERRVIAKINRQLIDLKLVEADGSEANRWGPFTRKLRTTFDSLDGAGLYLYYLGETKGYARHSGYVNNPLPNLNWRHQGAVCQYEHTIELRPLPPLGKDKLREHGLYQIAKARALDLEQLPKDAIEALKAEVEAQLPADAPETSDRASCPMFGHLCPGGGAQADRCRRH